MLKTRIVTSLILLFAFGIILWIGDKALSITSALITGLIVYEFLAATLVPSRRNIKVLEDDAARYSILLSLPAIAVATGGLEAAIFLTIVVVSFVLIRECYLFESMPDEGPAKDVLTSFAVALLYPFFFGVMFILSLDRISFIYQNNAWRIILWFVLLVVASDTGAYFGGKLLGKTKLAPRTSPNKTIEGAAVGFVSVITVALLLKSQLELSNSYANLTFVAVLVAFLAPVGDLVESWVKRIYGLKDMGNLLPGHGGVFDRVDSYIFASLALFLLQA